MNEPTLPDQAAYLRPLLGHWIGHGEGCWQAEVPFRYREEVTFAATGKPVLRYQQQTWAVDDGRPLHSELGYLRATGQGRVDLLVVQPTGFTEIHTGTLTDSALHVSLQDLGRAPAALAVSGLQRGLRVVGDTLTYLLRLAMNGEELADHLRGELLRQGPGSGPASATS